MAAPAPAPSASAGPATSSTGMSSSATAAAAGGSGATAPAVTPAVATAAVLPPGGDAAAAGGSGTSAATAAAAGDAVAPAPITYLPPTITWDASAPAPEFYNWRETFPFLGAVEAATAVIWEELRAGASRWFDWPETELYKPDEGQSWKVFPFLHTFPATDASKSTWIDSSVSACPRTAAVLRSIPGIRTALFSRMGPSTSLAYHRGWADLANHVLRCHLPLYVPDESVKPCGLIVEDQIRFHARGRILVFDDSKEHSAFNNHAQEARYVLIFDIVRPPGLPLGSATGSTTDELEAFINYFK